MLESPSDGISSGRRQVSSFEFKSLLNISRSRPVLAALPVPDGGGPRPEHPPRPLRAPASGVSRGGIQTRYW